MIDHKTISSCNHPLVSGRVCCHVRGHLSRHSHTWQPADARYLDIDERLIDMETGEIAGFTGDLGMKVIEQITEEPFHRKPEQDPECQAKARRVLEMYGATFTDDCGPVRVMPPAGYSWHYEGDTKAFGTDSQGHDVTYDFASGKTLRIYSVNQRHEAVDLARQLGPAKAARKLDIPAKTITSWINRGD